MLKKTISLTVAVLVMNLSIFAFAVPNEKEARFAEKVKSEIAKLGTGTDAKIKIKLKDGTKLKGYISEADNQRFVITDAKTGKQTPVSYPQVQTAKGNNVSSGVKILIGVVALVALVIILIAVVNSQGGG